VYLKEKSNKRKINTINSSYNKIIYYYYKVEDYIKPKYPDINKLVMNIGAVSVKNN
jgi:protein-tyrosine phosphatase